MPPLPKPEALRQRRNRTATKATLPTEESSASNHVPDLPEREAGWHPMVVEWWASIWRSPMASEYLDADMRGGLYLLADLHQVRWDSRHHPSALKEIASEIRLQEVRFGLSPIDRRRLQWTIEQGENAAERTAARRQAKKPPKSGKDMRSVLKAG